MEQKKFSGLEGETPLRAGRLLQQGFGPFEKGAPGRFHFSFFFGADLVKNELKGGRFMTEFNLFSFSLYAYVTRLGCQ